MGGSQDASSLNGFDATAADSASPALLSAHTDPAGAGGGSVPTFVSQQGPTPVLDRSIPKTWLPSEFLAVCPPAAARTPTQAFPQRLAISEARRATQLRAEHPVHLHGDSGPPARFSAGVIVGGKLDCGGRTPPCRPSRQRRPAGEQGEWHQ